MLHLKKIPNKTQAHKNLRTPPFPTQTGQQNHPAGTPTGEFSSYLSFYLDKKFDFQNPKYASECNAPDMYISKETTEFEDDSI
jgi:hypothetical protein